MRSRLVAVTFLTCLLTLGGIAQPANQQGGEQGSERDASAEAIKKDQPAQSEQSAKSADTKKKKNSDIFRPSEEISEDFAVPFPVDI